MVEHTHEASHGRYSKGCRCEGCRTAHREYERNAKRRRSRTKQGIDFYEPKRVDATEAREHIKFLRSKGVTVQMISNRVGLHRTIIFKISTAKTKTLRREIADAILAISTIDKDPNGVIDSHQTRQMVNDLRANGFTIAEIARSIGIPSGSLNLNKRVAVKRHQAIEELHKTHITKATS